MRLWMPALLAALWAVAAVVAGSGPLDLSAVPVPLDVGDPTHLSVGSLDFRGGLWLRSSDARLGGLSDLRVSPDGRRLLAITDCGSVLEASLLYDARGFLSGIADARLSPLQGLDGTLAGDERDAEAFSVLPTGEVAVAFEMGQRILVYPRDAPPFGRARSELPLPPDFGEVASRNSGLEALVALPNGRLLALAEGPRGRPEATRAWIFRDGSWTTLAYPLFYEDAASQPFRPTGVTVLPDGDVLVVERRFPPLAARLRRLPAGALRAEGNLSGTEVARLAPPLSVDNFEGIDAVRTESGETLVYLLSDDNSCAKGGFVVPTLQRTLLLAFALR
jgi:hypothetical protein